MKEQKGSQCFSVSNSDSFQALQQSDLPFGRRMDQFLASGGSRRPSGLQSPSGDMILLVFLSPTPNSIGANLRTACSGVNIFSPGVVI